MKTKMIDHYRTTENLEWRAFVKYGLPAIAIAGLYFAAIQGLASKYPSLFVISLILFFAGLYVEGKKNVHKVALLKIVNVFMLLVATTLLTGNSIFVILGTAACVVIGMLIFQKT
jgi:hypothetical protein